MPRPIRTPLPKIRRAMASTQELERWRGRVEERLDKLILDCSEERRGSSEYRKDMRIVIEALSESVRACTREVRVCSQEIAEMKPLVVDYREKRAEFRGAAHLSKTLWAGALGLAGLLGAAASEFARRWH